MNSGSQKKQLNLHLLKTTLILILLLVLFSCKKLKSLQPDDGQKPTAVNYNVSVQVDTMTRWFKVIIPSGYENSGSRPLLLVFHGGNLSMGFMYNNRKDLIDRCEQENWILVFPNGANFDDNKGAATWNAVHCCRPASRWDVDDIGFVRTMLDTLIATLNVDQNRIYAMGGSNGGMFTQRLAAEMPAVFAAAAPNQSTIGGQPDSLSPVVTIQPTQPIPIIMVHGMADRNVNFYGGQTFDGNRIDISFRESVGLWVQTNQCDSTLSDTTIVDGLNGKVYIVDYNSCNSGMPVRAIAIENKGHGWPGLETSGFDGTNAMIDFLKQFSK